VFIKYIIVVILGYWRYLLTFKVPFLNKSHLVGIKVNKNQNLFNLEKVGNLLTGKFR